MELIYTATGKPVAIGDIVRFEDRGYFKIVDVKIPSHPYSLGRVYVKSLERPFDPVRELMPYVVGAEWTK